MNTKHHEFNYYASREFAAGRYAKSATQFMRLYRAAQQYSRPTILELGVNTGNSTTVFLTACEEVDGHLVSVDIRDCSDITDSPRWTFVHGDSSDKEDIIRCAPVLREGIDLLFIDSLHDVRHVRRETAAWMPLVKSGGTIFFDDVDPTPYKIGNRKSNWRTYLRHKKIRKFVIDLYKNDEDNLYLSMDYGSTGLATLRKLS